MSVIDVAGGESSVVWNMWRFRAATVVLAIMLSGCGGETPDGGDGGDLPITPFVPAETDKAASNTVQLPAGCSASPSELKVVGGLNESAVGSNGEFTIYEPAGGPALVCLADASERLILLGYVDADDEGSSAVLDAKSSAVALLFRATGAFMLPASSWKDVLGILAKTPQAEQLAAIISQRLAENLTALHDGDETIETALAQAAGELVGEPDEARSVAGKVRAGAKEIALLPKSSIRSTVRRAGVQAKETPTVVLVDAGYAAGAKSGVQVMPNPEGEGIVIKNEYRRHLFYFIYRVGYKYPDVAAVAIPWEPVVEHAFLSSINDLGGVLGSLIDLSTGNVAYKPVLTDPITLPFKPADASQVLYKVIVVGPTTIDVDVLPADLVENEHRDKWVSDHTTVEIAEWTFEFVIPAVCTFLPTENIASLTDNPKYIEFMLGLYADTADTGCDIATSLRAKDYWGALRVFIRHLADSEELRKALLNRMAKAGFIRAGSMAEKSLLIAQKAAVIIAIFDKLYGAFDLGVVMTHMSLSNAYEQWGVTAIKPSVRLQAVPDQASFTKPATLLCTVSDIEGAKRYEWSTDPEGFGHFVYEGENRGTEFPSSKQTCQFRADDVDTEEGQTQMIHVKVFLTEGEDIELGEAEATVTFARSVINITPDPAFISNGGILTLNCLLDGELPTGGFTYGWSFSSDIYGRLVDPATLSKGRNITTTQPAAVLMALNERPPAPGIQNVRVEVRPLEVPDQSGWSDDLPVHFNEATIGFSPTIYRHTPTCWTAHFDMTTIVQVNVYGDGFDGPYGPPLRYHWSSPDGEFTFCSYSDPTPVPHLVTEDDHACIVLASGDQIAEGDYKVVVDVFAVNPVDSTEEYAKVGTGKLTIEVRPPQVVSDPSVYYHVPFPWYTTWNWTQVIKTDVEGAEDCGAGYFLYHWYSPDKTFMFSTAENPAPVAEVWSKDQVAVHPTKNYVEWSESNSTPHYEGYPTWYNETYEVNVDAYTFDENLQPVDLIAGGKVPIKIVENSDCYWMLGAANAPSYESITGVPVTNARLLLFVNGKDVPACVLTEGGTDRYWWQNVQLVPGDVLRFEAWLDDMYHAGEEQFFTVGPIYIWHPPWDGGVPDGGFKTVTGGCAATGKVDDILDWSCEYTVPLWPVP